MLNNAQHTQSTSTPSSPKRRKKMSGPSITYEQLSKQFFNTDYAVEDIVAKIIDASQDSFYIHKLRFEAEGDKNFGVALLMSVLQSGEDEEYLCDFLRVARDDEEAANRLYQIAYDEEQRMQLVLLTSWCRNHQLAKKFLRYFMTEMSSLSLDSRTKFASRIINVCLDQNTPHLFDDAFSLIPENAEKMIYFLEKSYQLNNQEFVDSLLKRTTMENIVDILMRDTSHMPSVSQTCDWLLKDVQQERWENIVQTYPAIKGNMYSFRRTLMNELEKQRGDRSEDKETDDESGHRKI